MKIKLIFLGLFIFLVSLAAYPDPELPELGGIWILNQDTSEYWYLHSIAEFDAPIERCNECHTGQDAFFDDTWLCVSWEL